MTEGVLDSLYSLFGESFVPQTIMISIEKPSTVSIKVWGDSIGEVNVDYFAKLVPRLTITVKISYQTTMTDITITNNSITSYKMKTLSSTNEKEGIQLIFCVNEQYDAIERSIISFKDTNSCNASSIIFGENADGEISNGAAASLIKLDKHYKSVSESIVNVVTYSLSTNFRKRCNALLGKEATDGLTVKELIEKKLHDMQIKEK